MDKQTILKDETLELFFEDKDGMQKPTKEIYEREITRYCILHEMTPTELIEEALQEEEKGIHKARRKIKKRLLKYKKHMKDKKLSYTYMQNSLIYIKAFYRNHDIEIPENVVINKPDYEPEVSDNANKAIPSKEMLQEALYKSDPKWEAIICLMTSSGMGAAEVCSLTYQHWIDAITCKHLTEQEIKKQGHYIESQRLKEEDYLDILHMDKLIREQMIIPVWSIKRIKTKFPYQTFCTYEAVKKIADYLRQRQIQGLDIKTMNDPLFVTKTQRSNGVRPMNNRDFTNQFTAMRKRFHKHDGYAKVGNVHLWRSHSMRRYASSNFYNSTKLDFFQSEWLVGHKRDGQDRTYYSKHTGTLREKYMAGLPQLCINWNEEELILAQKYMDMEQRLQIAETRLDRANNKLYAEGHERYSMPPDALEKFIEEKAEALVEAKMAEREVKFIKRMNGDK